MARFTGTYVNKVDSKGRVSIPAPFRTALEATGGASQVNLRPNPGRTAIEGVTEAYLDDVQRRLDAMDLYSPDRESLEIREFAEIIPAPLDLQGRVVLPRKLVEIAGIGGAVAFMGIGTRYQLWKPEALEAHQKERLSASRGLTLARGNGGAA